MPESSARLDIAEPLRLVLRITRRITEAESFRSAVDIAVRELCDSVGWDFGEAWIPEAGALQCLVSYSKSEQFAPLQEFTPELRLIPGMGLPGRVWQAKEPEWVPDMPKKPGPRAQVLKQAGLRAGLAVPIVAGGEVLCVLVFFMRHAREEDSELVQIISAAALQLGSVLQHKRAEEALLESEARLQSIINNSPSVIYVKNKEGRFILVNHEFEKLFRVPDDAIHALTDYDLFPKEQANLLRANDLNVMESGTSQEFEETVSQYDGLHTYLSVKFPLLDADGSPYALCGISTDITGRKTHEQREIDDRRKAESWLQSLIEATQDAVVAIDRGRRVALFNAAAEKMFGYTSEEIVGAKVNRLMAEPYAAEHDTYIERYERGGEPRAIGRIRTVMGRRKSGDVFPVELSVAEIKEDKDIRYATLIRDISEKTRLQNRLVEEERLAAIGTTAAKLAHEIGNPLNGMYLKLQFLERRLNEGSDTSEQAVRSTLRSLGTEIVRLHGLLAEFTSLSRREKYRFRPTELAGLVAQVVEVEKENFRAAAVEVKQSLAVDLPPIQADQDRLKQVLVNLCKNAVEAMPEGGTLTLRGFQWDDHVKLEIIDTGKGIPPGVDVFEPFLTTKAKGTGLGLMIVRQIVLAHQGTIAYASEAGKGTVFTLTLPLKQQPQP